MEVQASMGNGSIILMMYLMDVFVEVLSMEKCVGGEEEEIFEDLEH